MNNLSRFMYNVTTMNLPVNSTTNVTDHIHVHCTHDLCKHCTMYSFTNYP